MVEDDAVSVEGETPGGGGHGGRGVITIAGDGAPDRFEVDADLVESSGERAALDEGELLRGLEEAIRGDRGFARASGAGEGAALSLELEEGLADEALGLARSRGDDSPVELANFSGFEHGAEGVVGAWAEGDEEQAAGVAVESMEEPEVSGLAEVLEAAAVESEEPVEEGVGLVGEAGLGDASRGLVDDDEVVVLEAEVEGDVLVGLDGEHGSGGAGVGVEVPAEFAGEGSEGEDGEVSPVVAGEGGASDGYAFAFTQDEEREES